MYVHSVKFGAKNCTDLAIAVLAGGASRRFGSDKALVQLCPDGATLIEHVVDLAYSLSPDVFVVGHERYKEVVSDVPVIPDERPGDGPLAGILSALLYSQSSRVLVLACDMPCLSARLLRAMVDIDSSQDALVPRTADGRWHPMPAIYLRSVLPAIERALQDGPRPVSSIFEDVMVKAMTESELQRFDPALNSLFSLNRPQDLTRARECVVCK